MRNALKLCGYALIALAIVTGVSCSRDPNVVKVKYLENGNRYFEKGKYKEAYIMYRNALKKDLKYSEAYYRVALTEMRMGRALEASRDLRRAIDTDPKRQDARIQLAELYLIAYLSRSRGWQSLPPIIQTLSDELLKLNPKSAPGLRLRGYLELTGGRPQEAIATFRQANELMPLQPDIVLPLAQALFSGGQAADAEKLARALIEKEKTFGPTYDLLYVQAMRANRPADAESVLQLKIANNPTSTDFRLQLARHYYLVQRSTEMRAVLEKVGSKEFAGGRLKAGIFYRGIRDFDSALRQYQAGAREDPARKAAYQKSMAEVLVAQNKQPEALKVLEAVLKDDPNDDLAQSMRAALLVDTRNPTEVRIAVDELQAIVGRKPANAVLRFNLGRAQLALGQVDQAKTQFEEAAKLQKDYVYPRLALAQLHFLYRGDLSQSQQYANEVLQLDPRNLQALLIRSSALAAVGNLDQARADLAETIKAYPNSREAHIQVGMLDLVEKRYKEAEGTFSKLYQENPDDLRGVLALSETYALQKQLPKAIQLLQKESANHPERLDLRRALGNLEYRSGNYDLAIEHYQALVKSRPDAGEVYLLLGEVYRTKGDSKAAIDAFRKAKELRPNDPVPHLQMALLLDAQGQHAQARPIYEQILKLQPDNPLALNNLAYMMAQEGENLDQALAMAQRAKQKLPESLDVSDTLGWIYIKKNLSDNAIQIYRDLIAKQPERSTFRYHIGMALYQKGDKVQAKKELQAALQKKPSKEEEALIRELMSKLG
jgi:tetratricopeptide (TPR) repeat protein